MAGRIKGITIEIDGNTTKLQSALKGVDKSLRTTQNNLRDVNKLLKFNPGNVTLLKQKQDLLKKAVSDTKEKLDKEKEALAQLKDADQTPEVKAQMEALERQIIEDENALKNAKQELKDFGSVGKQQMQAVSDKVKEAGEKIKTVGDNMTKYVTGPIVAVGTASVAAFKSVDDGYDEMIKKTGATGDAANALRDTMNNLATSIPTDFETAGAAVGEVATRFGVTGQELETLSGQFIKFADLNNTDVSTSVDNVQKALSAFGLDAQAAGGFLDTLNKAGQDTGISVDKLATGLVTNGAAFQELGLSIEQSVGFMGQLETSGANSETVLNGMRKALKNATEQGIPLGEALNDLQNTIQNGTGEVDGLTAAYDLFGKSGDQIYAAVKNGTLDFAALGQAAVDAGGNIDSTFAETVDPVDQFKMTMNELKITGAEVGSSLLSMLAPAIEKIGEFIKNLKEKWDSLSPSTQDAIIKAAGIVAAIGPVISILGGVTTAIGALMSPIGLVVVAIAAAIAAGIAIYKNWDKIKAAAQKLGKAIKEKFDAIKQAIVTAFQKAKDKVTSIWNSIKNFISNVVNGIKNVIQTVFNAILTIVTTIMKAKLAIIKAVLQAAMTVFQTVWNAIKTVVTTVVNAIKTVITTVFNAVKSFITAAMNAIRTVISTVWNAIKTTVSTVLNAISTTISTIFNSILSTITAIWNAIKAAITAAVNAISSTVSAVFNAVKSTVSNVFNSIKSTASSIWNGIKSTITNAINAVKSTVTTVVSTIKEKLSFSGLADKVRSTFDSIKEKITSPIEKAKDKVKEIIDKVKGFFPLSIGNIFSNFKLPHIHVSGGVAPYGIGGKGSLPKFSVDWYAKGAIFKQPTIFATPGGLRGVGEAGAEAVLPLDALWMHMDQMGNNIIAGINANRQEMYTVMYRAMLDACSELGISINGREFGRVLRSYGAIS